MEKARKQSIFTRIRARYVVRFMLIVFFMGAISGCGNNPCEPAGKTLHIIDLGITKVYLLPYNDGYLLVDTGYKDDYRKFVKAIQKAGIPIEKIRFILLTHHHDDHAGFAARLKKETGAAMIVHRRALAPLGRGESDEGIRPVNTRVKIVFSIFELFHGNFRFPPVPAGANDIIIPGDDAAFLKGIGIKGRILYTPGHTPDSISVLLDDGSAFVGDLAMNFLNFTGIEYRPIFVEDEGIVFNSWKKLIDAGAICIYPAHGKPFPAERLAESRRKFTGQL